MEPTLAPPPVARARATPKNSAKSNAYSAPEPHPYRAIIDDVIRNSRDLFLEEGIDEQFLTQLQYLWEARLTSVLDPEGRAANDQLHLALAGTENHEPALITRPAAKSEGEPASKRQSVASKESDAKPEKLAAPEGVENDEELGSDLDEPEEQVPETDNLVLCQYEKVTRHKTKTGNRFKCVLKDGIMSLGGREILFHKGSGDAED